MPDVPAPAAATLSDLGDTGNIWDWIVAPMEASDEAKLNGTEGLIFTTTGFWPMRYHKHSGSTKMWL
jgi:hypothetical protein